MARREQQPQEATKVLSEPEMELELSRSVGTRGFLAGKYLREGTPSPSHGKRERHHHHQQEVYPSPKAQALVHPWQQQSKARLLSHSQAQSSEPLQQLESQALSRWEQTPPLPPGWELATDPASGRTYYADPETGESSWTPPPLPPPPPGGLLALDEVEEGGAVATILSDSLNNQVYRRRDVDDGGLVSLSRSRSRSRSWSLSPPHEDEVRGRGRSLGPSGDVMMAELEHTPSPRSRSRSRSRSQSMSLPPLRQRGQEARGDGPAWGTNGPPPPHNALDGSSEWEEGYTSSSSEEDRAEQLRQEQQLTMPRRQRDMEDRNAREEEARPHNGERRREEEQRQRQKLTRWKEKELPPAKTPGQKGRGHHPPRPRTLSPVARHPRGNEERSKNPGPRWTEGQAGQRIELSLPRSQTLSPPRSHHTRTNHHRYGHQGAAVPGDKLTDPFDFPAAIDEPLPSPDREWVKGGREDGRGGNERGRARRSRTLSPPSRRGRPYDTSRDIGNDSLRLRSRSLTRRGRGRRRTEIPEGGKDIVGPPHDNSIERETDRILSSPDGVGDGDGGRARGRTRRPRTLSPSVRPSRSRAAAHSRHVDAVVNEPSRSRSHSLTPYDGRDRTSELRSVWVVGPQSSEESPFDNPDRLDEDETFKPPLGTGKALDGGHGRSRSWLKAQSPSKRTREARPVADDTVNLSRSRSQSLTRHDGKDQRWESPGLMVDRDGRSDWWRVRDREQRRRHNPSPDVSSVSSVSLGAGDSPVPHGILTDTDSDSNGELGRSRGPEDWHGAAPISDPGPQRSRRQGDDHRPDIKHRGKPDVSKSRWSDGEDSGSDSSSGSSSPAKWLREHERERRAERLHPIKTSEPWPNGNSSPALSGRSGRSGRSRGSHTAPLTNSPGTGTNKSFHLLSSTPPLQSVAEHERRGESAVFFPFERDSVEQSDETMASKNSGRRYAAGNLSLCNRCCRAQKDRWKRRKDTSSFIIAAVVAIVMLTVAVVVAVIIMGPKNGRGATVIVSSSESSPEVKPSVGTAEINKVGSDLSAAVRGISFQGGEKDGGRVRVGSSLPTTTKQTPQPTFRPTVVKTQPRPNP